MSNATDRYIKRARIFLQKIKWKKILAFSFFLLIAAILWFMQIYNQTFETNIKIPIKYVSIPDSIIFTDSLPNHIDVRIKDYGYTMFKYYWKSQDTMSVNIASIINTGNGTKTLQGATYEMFINKSLSQTAQILRYEPARIIFAYSALQNRKIPVIFDGQVNLSPGYFLNGDIRISPDSVMAYGTMAELAKLTYAYTTSDTINGLETNRKIPIGLVERENIKLSPHDVHIYVPVEAYRRMEIEIPVECLNLPEDMIVKFFPSGVSLSFFVGVSIADSINLGDFTVGVDYNGIKDSKSVSVPVRITSSPPYAKSLTISPPNVEYVFEYKKTESR